MQDTDPNIQEAYLLDRLREILLSDDRERLARLEEILNNPPSLSPKVDPIIQHHLDNLREHFPLEYQRVVDDMIDWKLKGAQGKILDLIYPVIGKMIRKYVHLQFQQFRESLEQQIQQTLQRGLIGRLRYAVFGLDAQEKSKLLGDVDGLCIEEIYVVEQYSGILLGSVSRQETINLELVAGMLTAIKSFVEDAFKRANEDLEMIQYGSYSILIQNFYSFYIATAISGTITSRDEETLRDEISEFAQYKLLAKLENTSQSTNREIRDLLMEQFFNKPFRISNKQT